MADAERVSGIARPKVGRVIPNAPLRLPERQHLFHTPPPWAKSGEVFFVTICSTPRGQNQLANPQPFAVIREAFEYYSIAGKLWAHLLVAMPDHLHALLAFPSGEKMESVIRNLKRFIAKSARLRWQAGFFDHRLRSDESFEEKAHYIRMSPVRARLVSTPSAWPYVWPTSESPETAR